MNCSYNFKFCIFILAQIFSHAHLFFLASLSVLSHSAPPRVSGPPEATVSVLGGQPVEIECDLEGHPHPEYVWTWNGDEVTSNDITVVENLLTIER